MPRTRSNRVETPPPPEAPPSPTYTPTSPTYAPPSTTQGEEQAPQSTQPYDPYSASAASAYQRDPYNRDPYATSYNRGATSYNHDQGATSYNRDQGASSYNRDRSDMSGAYDPMNPGYSGQSRADRRHEPYRNQQRRRNRNYNNGGGRGGPSPSLAAQLMTWIPKHVWNEHGFHPPLKMGTEREYFAEYWGGAMGTTAPGASLDGGHLD